jgi:hypothetical protein
MDQKLRRNPPLPRESDSYVWHQREIERERDEELCRLQLGRVGNVILPLGRTSSRPPVVIARHVNSMDHEDTNGLIH